MSYPEAVTAVLLDRDGTTVITGALDNIVDASFGDPLSDVGSGSITLAYDDPGVAQIVKGRFVQILVGGTVRKTFKIQGTPGATQYSENGPTDENITVTGPGAEGILDEAMIYPAAALNLRIDTSWRVFSFASPGFPNAGSWAAAEEAYEFQDGVAYGARLFRDDDGIYYPAPVKFPVPTSPNLYDPDDPPGDDYVPVYWINPAGEEESIGYSFFLNTLTISTAGVYTIAATGDNFFKVFFEGVPLFGEDVDVGIWHGWKEIDLYLPVGTYTIGAYVENVDWYTYNPSGLLLTVHTKDGQQLPDAVFLVSDDSWDAYFSGEEWPGWTVGQIVNALLDEATARGELSAFGGGTFTDADDTDSNTWAHANPNATWEYVPTFAVDVGDSILAALMQLYKLGWIDWHMNPSTLELDVWAGDTVGSASGVTMAISTPGTPGNIMSLDRGPTELYANALLVQFGEGGTYIEIEDTGEQTAYGTRVPGFLATDAASEADAQILGETELERRINDGFPAILVVYQPRNAGEAPYQGFTLGDTVTIPNETGSGTVSSQVLGINMQTDPEGFAVWSIELGRRWRHPEKVTEDLLRSLGGRTYDYSGRAR